MSLTTTTYATIRDAIYVKVEALSPTLVAGHKFRRVRRNMWARDWSDANGTSALFRTFEMQRTGDASDPELLDPAAILRREDARLTVVYPLKLGLYGTTDLDAVEQVVRSDASQIRDAIFSSGNYVAGQLAAFVTIEPTDYEDGVAFQDFTVSLVYHEAQTLT